MVLSGGDFTEIKDFLKLHGLDTYFSAILAGPLTKGEHLGRITIERPAVFIGDSIHDFEVSEDFGLDFIFMSGYTRVEDWDKFPFPEAVCKVENFESL